MTDITEQKLRNLKPWQPGQSGNPAGRPKGAVHKITEATKQAFLDVFDKSRDPHIDPVEYLRMLATDKPELFISMWKHLLPKDIKLENTVSLQRIVHEIIDVTVKEDRESIEIDTSEEGDPPGYP